MSSTSTCPSCHSPRGTFLCQPCLSKLLKLYRKEASSHTDTLLPAAQAKARHGVALLKESRETDAYRWYEEQIISDLRLEIARLSREVDRDQQEVQRRRASLRARKERLQAARARLDAQSTSSRRQGGGESEVQPVAQSKDGKSIGSEAEERPALRRLNASAHSELADTRRILLREVMEALDVRPAEAMGCSYGIGSIGVPSLHEDLPKHLLNAILPLLILFMRLVAFYLEIKMPFTISGTPTKPLIKVTPGHSASAKFPRAYPLYASSGSSSSTTAKDHHRFPEQDSTFETSTHGGPSSALSASHGASESRATPASHAQALAIGIKMLAYNAAYIYHVAATPHAGLSDPPSASPAPGDDPLDILAVLVQACSSSTVGIRSHRLFNNDRDALKDTEWPELDFASFLKAFETRKAERRSETSGAVFDTDDTSTVKITKSRGTYVVIDRQRKASAADDKPGQTRSHPGPDSTSRPTEDDLDPFVVKGDEGWDLL